MNRRTLLKGTGSLTAVLLLDRTPTVFAQGTSVVGEFSELTITITDDAFDLPDGLTAGRYAITLVNAGTTPSHCSLGLLPKSTTRDEVTTFMSTENNDTLPDWFLNAGYVGLPDWPAPGGSLTGVIDLDAGDYFMFDPFSGRCGFVTVGEAMFSPTIASRVLTYFSRPAPVSLFPTLTEREREILVLIAQGKNNAAIAHELFLSPKTIANHVSNIFAKLQVADRSEAIIRARDAGLA